MSTDDQENSPERQRSDLTAFAAKQGYEIVEWYEDHGLSGTSTDDRLDFQRLEDDANSGQFDILLACEISRLSREEPLDAMTRLSQFLNAGIRFQTIDGRFVDLSDIGSMITTLVATHGAAATDSTVKLWDVETHKPLWLSVSLSKGNFATFTATGEQIGDTSKELDDFLAIVMENDDGRLETITPSEFQRRTQQSQ